MKRRILWDAVAMVIGLLAMATQAVLGYRAGHENPLSNSAPPDPLYVILFIGGMVAGAVGFAFLILDVREYRKQKHGLAAPEYVSQE